MGTTGEPERGPNKDQPENRKTTGSDGGGEEDPLEMSFRCRGPKGESRKSPKQEGIGKKRNIKKFKEN